MSFRASSRRHARHSSEASARVDGGELDMATARASTLRRPLTKERPFPGPEPYRESDVLYFKGRRAETDELERLVRRAPLTTLFGASGLGKSSLLLAGLFPRLSPAISSDEATPEASQSRTFFPVWVRLKPPSGDTLRPGAAPRLALQVTAGVREAAAPTKVELEHAEDAPTLWEYFHQLEAWSEASALLTPLIVLDQFEELFTLGRATGRSKKAVDAFFEELAEVVENRIPSEIRKGVRAPERAQWGDRPAHVRIVLSLREEYLPDLEAHRRQMPSVLQNRMRLLPFAGDRAKDAIVESAGRLMDEPVATAIVQAVAGWRPDGPIAAEGSPAAETNATRPLDELSVEPSLLNLFCYQLNERRLSRTPVAPKIEYDLVKRAGEDILGDFVASCLSGLGERVRDFVETGLLSKAGYRLPLPLAVARDQWGITDGQLDTLAERRLVRKETRANVTYVEVVHDVLAK